MTEEPKTFNEYFEQQGLTLEEVMMKWEGWPRYIYGLEQKLKTFTPHIPYSVIDDYQQYLYESDHQELDADEKLAVQCVIDFMNSRMKPTKTGYTDLDVFIKMMVVKLNQNNHKPGWENDSVESLFTSMQKAVNNLSCNILYEKYNGGISDEAANVANYAMMIAMNASRKNMPPPEEMKDKTDKKQLFMELEIKGIKCDNKECGWKDLEAEFDPDKYLNMPCPECGSNLLTEQDYKNTMALIETQKSLNEFFGDIKDVKGERTYFGIDMDGSGSVKITPIEK